MDDEQEVHLKKLEDLVTRFNVCFRLLGKEEDENNNEELIAAWKLILRNHVRKIFDLLKSLKIEIAWSLLDDKKERFYKIKVELEPTLTSYKDYEGEEMRKMVNDIILLTDEGFHGFRQSFVNETYCEDLFLKEIDRYRKENEDRLERIYKQDSQDEALFYPDETQLKNHMLLKRKEKLFNSQFGLVFHNNGRDIKMTVVYILGKKEQTYDNINDFLDKYAACQNVFNEYGFALENGGYGVDQIEDTIAQYQAALDEAGYQDVLAAFQAQYEEWKKENSEEDKDDDTASSVEEEMSSEAE